MRRIAFILAFLLGTAPAFAQSEGAVAPGNRAPRSNLTGCTYNSAGVTLTDGQQAATQCDAAGNQKNTVSAGTVTITQTVVTLTAATSATLIAANASRKYLCWMNVGTAPFTVAPGAVTVTAGQGFNYDPGSSASNQGGAFCEENSAISQQAFSAISTVGTTVAVWEGR